MCFLSAPFFPDVDCSQRPLSIQTHFDPDSLNATTEERPSKCKEILQDFVNESVNSVSMSLSYMEKRYHRGYFFLLRQKCFPRADFTPEGRLYARAKRGLVIETQGGKGCPRIRFCLRRKKYSRWDRFAMEDVIFFQFGGNSLRQVNV